MKSSANEPEGDDFRCAADAYARSLTLLARNKGYLHAILSLGIPKVPGRELNNNGIPGLRYWLFCGPSVYLVRGCFNCWRVRSRSHAMAYLDGELRLF
jgi:hypothetical protein